MTATPNPDVVVDALARSLLDSCWLDEHTYDLPFGTTLRLTFEPDDCSSIFDDSGPDTWCGSLEPASVDYSGRVSPRPSGFTGAAEIIYVGRSHDPVWWQPPADLWAPSDERNALRRHVSDLLESGYYVLTLEHRHNGRTLAAASLGGICPDIDSVTTRDFLSDLYSEVCYR